MLEIQPNTAALFYKKVRQITSYYLDLEATEIFAGARKGKRGRGAAGKVIVFGILKRRDKVYTVVVENHKK